MLKQIPIVERLREALLADISGKSMTAGDRIPAEGKLAEQYGVSRNTVREVMIQLESEGMVARCHGVGTILRRSPKVHLRSVAIPDMIRRLGMEAGVEKIAITRDLEIPEIAEKFRLTSSALLMRLERVLTANGRPVAYVADYLAQAHAEKWNVDWSEFDGNLIQLLAANTGGERFLQNASVSATLASGTSAEMLQYEPGGALVEVSTDLFSETVELLAVSRLLIVPGSLPVEFAGTIHATAAP